jgi:hypothetical protein
VLDILVTEIGLQRLACRGRHWPAHSRSRGAACADAPGMASRREPRSAEECMESLRRGHQRRAPERGNAGAKQAVKVIAASLGHDVGTVQSLHEAEYIGNGIPQLRQPRFK